MSDGRAELAEAVRMLRDRGVTSPDQALRLAAAAVAARCCAAFDERGNVGAGWLCEAVRQGGGWEAVAPRPSAGMERPETSAEFIERRNLLRDLERKERRARGAAALDSVMGAAGIIDGQVVEEVDESPFAHLDRAAGLL